MPDDPRADLLQGTLDLLILKALALGPMHGWGIAQRLRQLSSEALQVQQGSLYPAVHRLERQGLIRSSWGQSENNRRARFYELTRAGQRRLAEEAETWERFAAAVAQVLGATT
jgi:transcriptional regulator